MKFKTTQHGKVTVISLQGSLMGGPDATELKDKVHNAIESGRKLLVVDLGGVDLMNSSGLGILIKCASTARDGGGRLVIAGASKKVLELFKITRLTLVFETHDSVENAITALKQ
jgi:anti-sigma B factor antagonist